MSEQPKKELSLLLKMLAEDREKILYRRKLAMLTDSVTAAILLQQILFRYTGFGCEAFYKYREQPINPKENFPCKPGDSWTDELGFNVSEFDHALKRIATKITKGVSRKAVLATEFPERHPQESNAMYAARFEAALKAIVIYWTDSNRVTWYDINTGLLDKFINCVYLSDCNSLRYLKSQVSSETIKARKADNPEKMHEVEDQKDSSKTPSNTLSKRSANILFLKKQKISKRHKRPAAAAPQQKFTFQNSYLRFKGWKIPQLAPQPAASPSPGSAPPSSPAITPKEAQAWSAAYDQMQMQFDTGTFNTWVLGAELVTVEPALPDSDSHKPTFVIAARHEAAREALQGRLNRSIERILSDVYGQVVATRFEVSAVQPMAANGLSLAERIDPAGESAPPAARASTVTTAQIGQVMQRFDANIAELTPLHRDSLTDLIRDCGLEAVEYGIREAVRHEKRSLAYVEAVAQRKGRELGYGS